VAPDDLSQRLSEKRAAIDAELEVLTTQPEDAGSIQFGKRAGDATNVAADQLSRVATHEQLFALRAEIDHAQSKVAAGTYGTCDRCGGPIGDARLEVLPWAALCVGCRGEADAERP
jgi:DnaK suppressor protein